MFQNSSLNHTKMAPIIDAMLTEFTLDDNVDGSILGLMLTGILISLIIAMLAWDQVDKSIRRQRVERQEKLHKDTLAHLTELMEAELGTAPNWQTIMSDTTTHTNFHIILNGDKVPSAKDIAEKLTLVRRVCPASCWVAKGYQLCCICIEEIQPRSTIRTLECGHIFHNLCIVQWLTRTKPNCPLCHQQVTTQLPRKSPYTIGSGYQCLEDL